MTLKSIQEYGKGFQIKVLSSLLTHKEFLANIYDILNEEDFNNQAHRWIVKEIIKYYDNSYTDLYVIKDVAIDAANTLVLESNEIEYDGREFSLMGQLNNSDSATDIIINFKKRR